MKLRIITIGKIKSRPVRELVDDYKNRLGHYLPIEILAVRDDEKAISIIDVSDFLVVLDERGAQMNSVELSGFISGHMSAGTKNVVFFAGGEDGVGEDIKKRANLLFGLSKLTFPHELVQVILLEQLYRACSIIRGEPYHRR